jgi:hypothetical protein
MINGTVLFYRKMVRGKEIASSRQTSGLAMTEDRAGWDSI